MNTSRCIKKVHEQLRFGHQSARALIVLLTRKFIPDKFLGAKLFSESADPGRRKGECVREKEFMTQLPGKNNNNSLTLADARGSA